MPSYPLFSQNNPNEIKPPNTIGNNNGQITAEAAPVEKPPQKVPIKKLSIVDLQDTKTEATIDWMVNGNSKGSLTLINLNPSINVWYLVQMDMKGQINPIYYHIENPKPSIQILTLDPEFTGGLVIQSQGLSKRCDLWSGKSNYQIEQAKIKKNAFVPICDDQLYLRNPTTGHTTAKERVVDFLRSYVPGGEDLTTLVKEVFFKDKFLIDGQESYDDSLKKESSNRNTPTNAAIDPRFSGSILQTKEMGITIDPKLNNQVLAGAWYETELQKKVYVSLIEAKMIEKSLLESHKKYVKPLDSVEQSAYVYLVAFDLNEFEIGMARGTDHPDVTWSDRVLDSVRSKSLAGPDGIDSVAPIHSTGIVSPQLAPMVISSFTGGFKRNHAAFKWGTLAQQNHGSHYGFIEEGIVYSVLQPGLATILVNKDGSVEMKTWREEDHGLLANVRYARQNGVPVIDYDEKTKQSFPGHLVGNWGAGNWSGSSDRKFRTVRAGACLQVKENGKKFLIYGYFSSTTPSAMARVFQSYHCRYALHLDMNALEHTYLSLLGLENNRPSVQHLVGGMNVLDKKVGEDILPRFIGYSDNRDFFYITRKN
jgi:hypothetical protein